jgi:hypothetical protein
MTFPCKEERRGETSTVKENISLGHIENDRNLPTVVNVCLQVDHITSSLVYRGSSSTCMHMDFPPL